MNAIKRILQYISRRKEIHRAKKKVLDERIDFDNIVSSAFHAKELYNELKTICHPDRFHDSETIAKATELFQAVTENRGNYDALLQLKGRIYNELPINKE